MRWIDPGALVSNLPGGGAVVALELPGAIDRGDGQDGGKE